MVIRYDVFQLMPLPNEAGIAAGINPLEINNAIAGCAC